MKRKSTDAPGKTSGSIPQDQKTKVSHRLPFPVVAIGASAGGLEALRQFFDAVPKDPGITFVVIQHLDPKKKSNMAEILSWSTAMPVSQISQGDTIEVNHAYVVPPGKKLTMQGGRFILEALTKDNLLSTHTIDEFLRSMAAEQDELGICVILSGTGTDGTLGLKAIKMAGGMVMAQEPANVGYNGMPLSAITTGLVDFILPAGSMPGELLQYVQHGCYTSKDTTKTPKDEEIEPQVSKILDLLGTRKGNNFSGYKRGTLFRRIQRRMSLRHLEEINSYYEILTQDDEELTSLAKDFLIVVTGFFRDQEAFALLQSKVIAPICEKAVPEIPIRVWVAGTSTGEEAYSVAILFMEELARCHKEECTLQIFATDIDTVSLTQARSGIFPVTIEADVSRERLNNFFEKKAAGYLVKKNVRDTITFSEQDLLRDPPFSRIDLITCRNLLIYLKPETQRHILTLFHFSLRSGGALFLGNAETIGREDALFQPIDKMWRIYQKIDSVRIPQVIFPRGQIAAKDNSATPPVELKKSINLKTLGESQILQHFSPCGVIINKAFEILQFIGSTNLYLIQPDGPPTTNLLSLVPLPMRPSLRSMLNDLISRQQTLAALMLRLPDHEGRPYRLVKINSRRIEEQGADLELFLVTFTDLPEIETTLPQQPDSDENSGVQEMIIHQLEEELLQTRDNLESTIEQMETANEELKAGNEEAMSINEEFQATNAELETSKEELQSTNEELTSVNSELEEKLVELEETNNDLDNLLASSDVGFLFLDEHFHIKRFTPAIQKLFRILPTDIGRPLEDFGTVFSKLSMLDDAKKVLQDLIPIERDIQTKDGRWYLKRVLPYRTSDNHIKGVLVTFLDVSTIKEGEKDALRQAAILKALNDTLPLQVAYVDPDERHLFANKAYLEVFDLNPDQVMGLKLKHVMWPALYAAAVPFVKQALSGKSATFEQAFDGPSIGRRDISCSFSPHFDEHGRVSGFFAIMQDMTAFRLAESIKSWLSAIVDSSHDAIISRAFDGTIRSWNKGAEQMFGYSALEMLGNKIDLLFPAEQLEGVKDFDILYRGAGEGHSELSCQTKVGNRIAVELTQSPIMGQDGEPVAVSVILTDISVRKEMERMVLEVNKNLEIKVAERTLSLQQSMNQLRRMALELTQTEQRERQRLATVLHNDLQQLLVAAGLRLERLANSENDPDKRQAIGQIETLISQSVAATRSLASDLKPPVLNNSNLVKSLHWLADWLWKRFDFTLKISVPTELRTDNIPNEDIVFLFDSARELCFNIVKHSHVKEGRMTLQLTAQKRLRLTIADDGVGMDVTQQNLPPQTDGGLGLTAIRERLDLMGGELQINTAIGKGFCADIILPYALKEVARPRLVTQGKKKGKPAASADRLPPTQKIRVMLVDDHAVVRDGLRVILLDEADIDVIGEAGDGEKALKLASKQRPDVILMDVNMPKMNGIEATKLIKQDFPEICIIALSINDDPGTNNAMLEAGACAYMSKSGSADKVCQMIRACMEGRPDSTRALTAASKPEGEDEEDGA